MRTLTVVSEKGGTGKTSILASLAHFAEDKVLVDCDVEAEKTDESYPHNHTNFIQVIAAGVPLAEFLLINPQVRLKSSGRKYQIFWRKVQVESN